MLYSFVINVSIGTVIFIVGRKNKALFWLSMVYIVASITAITDYFRGHSIPYIYSLDFLSLNTKYTINNVNEILISFFNYMYWYVLFIYSIYDSILFSTRLKKYKLQIILLGSIIPLCTFFTVPANTEDYRLITFVAIWASIYCIFSITLIFTAYFKETIPEQKKARLYKILFFLPPIIYALLANNILYALGYTGLWEYELYFVIIQSILVIVFSFKYSVLGIQLKLDNVDISNSITSASLSTSFINHTLKNEINKIKMFTDIMINNLNNKEESLESHLLIIKEASEHLLNISDKIHSNLSNLRLEVKCCSLNDIVNDSITRAKQYIEDNNIKIVIKNDIDKNIYCDELCVKEVFNNLLLNSIESINGSGLIEIKAEYNSQYLVVLITDNGCGISKNDLINVFKPFFTTKSDKTNYGIGLSYCYKVIKEHGGYISISSKKKKGTSIHLGFPISA